MLFNLLDETNSGGGNSQWLSWGLIILLVVVMVVAMILMNRRSKKQRQEAEDLINAVKPGNKVKTIGGVCGIVVEVDADENTFVLETGSETAGKCYMKFDRQAILQSDAVVEKSNTKKPETSEDKAQTDDGGHTENKEKDSSASQSAEENGDKAE